MADKDAIQFIDKMLSDMVPKVMLALNNTAKKVEAKVLRQHLAGPTSDSSVSKRSGALGRSFHADPAKVSGTIVSSDIHAGVDYAKTHFGPKGSTITIKPKGGKRFLTIPTDFARTNAGVAKGKMEQAGGKWTFLGMATFIQKGVIFGYAQGANLRSEGTRQRRAAGETFTKGTIIPLFILKSSVVVKRRVDPKVDMVDWAKPVLVQELKRAGLFKV